MANEVRVPKRTYTTEEIIETFKKKVHEMYSTANNNNDTYGKE